MKKYKKLIPVIAVSAMFVLLLSSSSVVSFLVDKDEATNSIHIGNVALAVTEANYTDNQIVVAGSKLTKDPVVSNTGSLPEYVFIRVAVPKDEVVILNEHGEANEGGKKYTPKKYAELFRIDATQTGASYTAVPDTTTPTYVDFKYNKYASASSAGWLYLETQDATVGGKHYNYHYFGYNTALASSASTIPLFNTIQLKSFIEGDTSGGLSVDVFAYGIQSDNVPFSTAAGTYLTDAQIGEVWTIVKNKEAAGGDY